MTRVYAARKLLEHGRLTPREFIAITGWPPSTAGKVLVRLVESGQVHPYRERGTRRALYGLVHPLIAGNTP